MPLVSPPSPRGDGKDNSGDGDRENEEAAVEATRVSPLAGPLRVWGRRGRWPGPGYLRAPGAAASAPARGAQPPSRPESPGLSAGVTGLQGPLCVGGGASIQQANDN